MLELELVLPCYNESKSIEPLLRRVIAAAKTQGFTPERFRLVLVENGSLDDSRTEMSRLAERQEYREWFRVVPVDHNQGYGFGIWSGLSSTTAPVVAWSHADQQCDPNDVFRARELLGSLPEASQARTLIKGVRRGRSLKEQLVSRLFDLFALLLLSLRAYEINAQPKVFRRELLAQAPNPPKDFAFDIYMLYRARKLGYAFETIEVSFPPRMHGFSNWANSLRSRSRTIWNMIKYMGRLGRIEGRV